MSNLVNVTVPAHTSNYSKGRSGRKIETITIHHVAGVLSAEQIGYIFQRAGRNGSSHYGIGNDGRIGLYVDESNTAWTNSNWDSNCKSVTIETSNNATGGDWTVSDTALNSLIKLVADIAKRNGLGTLVKGQNVTWHRMYVATTCPGNYLLSKMDYIVAEANKLNAVKPAPQPSPQTANIEQMARDVIAGKYGNGEDRKRALGSNYGAVQAEVNRILTGKAPAPAKKSVDTIAREIIAGKWGNGSDRKRRIENAGYNYREVQNRVNSLLR